MLGFPLPAGGDGRRSLRLCILMGAIEADADAAASVAAPQQNIAAIEFVKTPVS